MEPVEVKASLDRFEGDYAIVYSDDGRKFDVARTLLPKRARQGARLKLTISENDKVASVSIDREGEKELKKKIKEKLERIKRGEHLA
ncbi:MAG TPA: DUF3006 domain-containing protein [Nitrososphaera sp.]|jgi:hypothetical protein|nr:DUF3006 domain-containing protein [uncultured Nitrososphaera sp.]